MNIDFHFGVINILARAAGFSSDDAYTLAFASQYVDDCTFYKPFNIKYTSSNINPDGIFDNWISILKAKNQNYDFINYRKNTFTEGANASTFNPVCTGHLNLKSRILKYLRNLDIRDILKIVGDDSLKKVFVSFHFVPAKLSNIHDVEFTLRNSSFLKSYIEILLAIFNDKSIDPMYRDTALIAAGIALHSYADSWSHEGFSGIWSPEDNDIKKLSAKREYDAREIGSMPDIGHLEAMSWPDSCHSEIEIEFCTQQHGRSHKVKRKNYLHFLEAAQNIFKIFCNGSIPKEISEFLYTSMRTPLEPEERLSYMREGIRKLPTPFQFEIPHYYNRDWEHEIIELYQTTCTEEYFYDPEKKWFKFQIAAMAQRLLVMSKLN